MSEREIINKKSINHVAADVVFKGTVEFQDKLVVSGLILGNIVGETGNLEITKQGEVQGKSQLNTLQNHGKISGETSAQTVRLFNSSISHSDFSVQEITVDAKAIVNGKISMSEPLSQ